MFVDYYNILGIAQNSTKAQIKSAYRKQAVKWHPDKNPGKDTTQIMQVINEAYLILYDDEARSRYDREYSRFKSFQQEKEKAKETEEPKQKQHENKRQNQEQKSNQNQSDKKSEKQKEEYSTFQFDDEILKKWMENAKKQAVRNVYEMIVEFRDSTLVGFGTFFKTAFMAIVVAIIYFIIILILRSI